MNRPCSRRRAVASEAPRTSTRRFVGAGRDAEGSVRSLERRLWGRPTTTKTPYKVALRTATRTRAGRRPPAETVGNAATSAVNGAAQESNLPSVGLRRRTGFEDQLGHQPRPLPRAG